MGVAFADYDNDGLTDIFVSNDTFPNYLLHNNGDGTFTDVAVVAGVAYTESGKTVAGMGADFRDLDNDGKPDIFHTAMFGDTFPLYRNLGGGQFEDATVAAGLGSFTGSLTGWGTGAFDFDNDGYKDLFTANSEILDNSMQVAHRPFALPNGLFRNKGSLTFEDLSAKAGAAFHFPPRTAEPPLVTSTTMERSISSSRCSMACRSLLMNRSGNQNHWIILKLIGTKSNRDGIGTRIKVTTSHGSQYNHATTAVGYNSSSDKRVHFGLGQSTVIDRIELQWPSGIKQVLTQVKADQVLAVRETPQ